MNRLDTTKRTDTRSFFTGKCLLVITGRLTGIEWMGKGCRPRNDVEGCVWPFRWQLSLSAPQAWLSIPSNPWGKACMHARGEIEGTGATKG